MDYIPSRDEHVAQLYPEVPRAGLDAAVHFIDADGAICQGAEAVFRALATNPSWRWPLRLYQGSSLVARSAECSYRFVARHRSLFSWMTRILWGRHVERPDHLLVRRLFLGLLGTIYLIAFVSLWVQVTGLVGKDGILPAADLMSQAHRAVAADGIGIGRYHLLPTLCWLDASDAFLKLQCAAGTGLALLLIIGVAPPLCLALMWLLYLSLTTVGGDFLAFQWDNLLLETGVLAIFLGPFQWLPRRLSRERPSLGAPVLPVIRPVSRTVLWLLRLLLFKLMFLSGVVKLASGDAAWRSLSALSYHYQTQPLPNWISWYVHQLPLWFQKTSCAVMFVIELGTPFLIFLPRRARMAGGVALLAFQVLILLTGNYTFFNWLTIALCLLLFDDFALRAILSKLWRRNGTDGTNGTYGLTSEHPALPRRLMIAPVALLFVSISIIQLLIPFGPLPRWTSPVVAVYRWLSPFRSINSYGLFAVMTTERPEIIVEGSNDGRDWKEYAFRYKPGDLNRRPGFVAPYQPRLDWQMWFAALGSYRQNPWFVHFCIRLLEGSPDVLALLANNPFPGKPPKYVRALAYDYQFTNPAKRARTGAWWKRTLKGQYLPPISLEMLQPYRTH